MVELSTNPYLSYEQAKHGLCNAHLVRELVFLIERHAQQGASSFLELLLDMKKKVEDAKGLGQTALYRQYLTIFEQGGSTRKVNRQCLCFELRRDGCTVETVQI